MLKKSASVVLASKASST